MHVALFSVFLLVLMLVASVSKMGKKSAIPIVADQCEDEWSAYAARIARKQNPHN